MHVLVNWVANGAGKVIFSPAQVMAYHLCSAKPLPALTLNYCQFDPLEYISVKFNSNTIIFIQENLFENVVCKMSAILFGPQGINCTASHESHVYKWQRLEEIS